jgi:hypothetical protein
MATCNGPKCAEAAGIRVNQTVKYIEHQLVNPLCGFLVGQLGRKLRNVHRVGAPIYGTLSAGASTG